MSTCTVALPIAIPDHELTARRRGKDCDRRDWLRRPTVNSSPGLAVLPQAFEAGQRLMSRIEKFMLTLLVTYRPLTRFHKGITREY